MANGIFLTNPELIPDNVTVTPSAVALGGRAGKPIPAAGNSGAMTMNAIGSSGDTLSHDVVVYGTQQRPTYDPRDDAGLSRYTDPDSVNTFTSAGTIAITADLFKLCVAYDQLFLIAITGAGGPPIYSIEVYRYAGGTTWTPAATVATDAVTPQSVAVFSRNGRITIAILDDTINSLLVYRFHPASATINYVLEYALPSDVLTSSQIAMATDGTTIVLLVQTSIIGDFVIYTGPTFGGLVRQPLTLGNIFGSTWGTSVFMGIGLTWNKNYGFVGVVQLRGTSPNVLRLFRSSNGSEWELFKDLAGAVSYPTVSNYLGSNPSTGIELENTRVFLHAAKSATDHGTTRTDLHLEWFNGRTTWVVNKEADGSQAPSTSSDVTSRFYRGTIFYAYYVAAINSIQIRRCNELTTVNTGYRRELRLGQKNYLDGPMDDTRTALSVVPTGEVRAGDTWTVPQYYDYAASNMLVESLGEPFRTADGGTPNVVLDAGSGRRHIADAIAIILNVPAINDQFNATDSWGAPSSGTLALSSVRDTLTVSSADGTKVIFTTSPWSHDELVLRPHWANLSTGIFRVIANGANWIKVDGNPGSPSTSAGAATIYGDRMGYFPAEQVYQFSRLVWPSALTLPNFAGESTHAYEVKRYFHGSRMDLAKNYGVGFRRVRSQPNQEIQLRGARRVPRSVNDIQPMVWELMIPADTYPTVLRALEGFYARTQGPVKQFVFWPAGTTEPNNFEVCRFAGELAFNHVGPALYASETFRIVSEVA